MVIKDGRFAPPTSHDFSSSGTRSLLWPSNSNRIAWRRWSEASSGLREAYPSQSRREKSWSQSSGYGSIPINTILSGMNIHLPAILGFTRYQGFDPSPSIKVAYDWDIPSIIYHHLQIFDDQFRLFDDPYGGSHPSKSGLIPFISSINGMLIYKLMDYLFEPIHHL